MTSIVAWSRIFNGIEIVCAINTDVERELMAFVTVDAEVNADGAVLSAIYEAAVPSTGSGTTIAVQRFGGRAAVQLTVPAAGFVMFTR